MTHSLTIKILLTLFAMVTTLGVQAQRRLRGTDIMSSIKTNLGCRVRIISKTKDKFGYAHVSHSLS